MSRGCVLNLNFLLFTWIFCLNLLAHPVVKIKQGTYSFVSSGFNIDSGGFGPCRAVIIYSKATKEAIAGHLDEDGIAQLKSMILYAKKSLGSVQNWEVYMSGAFSAMTTADERSGYIRTFLSSGVAINKLHIRWLPGASTGSLFFNTEQGNAFLSVHGEKFSVRNMPFKSISFNKPKKVNSCTLALTRLGLRKFSKSDFEIAL